MTTMTKGKFRNLEKLANKKGVIAAAAMDQRGSLQKSIAKAKGCDPSTITDQHMAEFKTIVTKVLTPHSTAILLDPEY
ncbi:MAG: tagatose 1,6-diphosphate aldolase, partial [Deltaproteobacteria bacterium]|nr:tagatose 1,6-diphosphate aldolase [Deltaproteobacteria bacterium]